MGELWFLSMLIKIILQWLKSLFFGDGEVCHYDVLNKQGEITSTGRNSLQYKCREYLEQYLGKNAGGLLFMIVGACGTFLRSVF